MQYYTDAGGRIRRRLTNYPCDHEVPQEDFIEDMAKSIIENELPWVFMRLVRQYHALRVYVGGRLFRSTLPPGLADFQQEMAEEANPNLQLLLHGNDKWRVMMGEEGAITPLRGLHGKDFKVDDCACKTINIRYQRLNVCDNGGVFHIASLDACGDHYSRDKRGRLFAVVGARLPESRKRDKVDHEQEMAAQGLQLESEHVVATRKRKAELQQASLLCPRVFGCQKKVSRNKKNFNFGFKVQGRRPPNRKRLGETKLFRCEIFFKSKCYLAFRGNQPFFAWRAAWIE